jgi:hypothetical protein
MSTLTLTRAEIIAAEIAAKRPYTPAELPDALQEAKLLRSKAQNGSLSRSEEDSIIQDAKKVDKKVTPLLRQNAHAGHFVMGLVYQDCLTVQRVITSVYHIILSRRDANAHTLVDRKEIPYYSSMLEAHRLSMLK